ncbi:glycosyltransferase family 2 protein [Chromobacterium violaceum]|uniref:glycosyltransferase family 2 protein n=1 Tax=Chromobacterium violaceum TaxID=536 RepID=UPI001C6F2E67|nr:glycosyltransferase [Chromobacterium violaceum]
MTKLSIIIPCLNEEENVEQILDSVTAAVSGKITDYEIIIVDDQSDDSTLSLAQKWSVENPNSKVRVLYKELHRRGYGPRLNMVWLLLRESMQYLCLQIVWTNTSYA